MAKKLSCSQSTYDQHNSTDRYLINAEKKIVCLMP